MKTTRPLGDILPLPKSILILDVFLSYKTTYKFLVGLIHLQEIQNEVLQSLKWYVRITNRKTTIKLREMKLRNTVCYNRQLGNKKLSYNTDE